MLALRDIRPNMAVDGIRSDGPVSIFAAQFMGNALHVVFQTCDGTLDQDLLYEQDEPRLAAARGECGWDFTADGAKLRFALEARRIRMAHLFDPYLALSMSVVEPLPHQISAVYQEMLPRLPLRYVLADDPGAGKTIMAGLLIKELLLRGALERCLIVCPGNLTEQWQDELKEKFGLSFSLLTQESSQRSRGENPFVRDRFLIARLDTLARNRTLQEQLEGTCWDLIVCDEAHKMSATVAGRDIKRTARFRLGQKLSDRTEHFLLLTATPHNGKEEDFQLFMSLIDKDRFDVAPGQPLQPVDVSDVMRRLAKEDLLRFDGTALFPERHATTIRYTLSPAEHALYDDVTQYVREEFNRADRLESDRRNTVGFALMILQRRLASSPEAICQSLSRRRKRLEQRRRDMEHRRQQSELRDIRPEDLMEGVLSSTEEEQMEDRLVDGATAARTEAELDAEIATLRRLEAEADAVRKSGLDQKWNELADLLSDDELLINEKGRREKIIVFTEHVDTIRYLRDKITTLRGTPDTIVTIHGSLSREERQHAVEEFRMNPDIEILLATDAAGEGVNLQTSHMVINYDLPWNPNRLEQRFGRVHRIGQRSTCYLWNLVSTDTREGRVYEVLLEKLRQEQRSLPGKVYDVLGEIQFGNKSLRELLIAAVRARDSEDVERLLLPEVEAALRAEKLRELMRERALSDDVMDPAIVMQIREDMERMEAGRLQPHFIESFAISALHVLGGRAAAREPGRYEVTRLPKCVSDAAPRPLAAKYERICFEKGAICPEHERQAEFVTPGHPLLEAIIAAVDREYGPSLARGAVLIDEADPGREPRLLFGVEMKLRDGNDAICSQSMHFVEITRDGQPVDAGAAPYLDYRPPTDDEMLELRAQRSLCSDVEKSHKAVQEYAVRQLLPVHLAETRHRIGKKTDKTWRAVSERLTAELEYLREERRSIRTGTKNAASRQTMLTQRMNDIEQRLTERRAKLDRRKEIHSQPPRIAVSALVLPRGLVDELMFRPRLNTPDDDARRMVESAAMNAVMYIEHELGFLPRDVSSDKRGYDIESAVPQHLRSPDGSILRFIEVKGRTAGAESITVTKNEVLTALTAGDQYILAIVEVDGNRTKTTYIAQPFRSQLDFAATSAHYSIRQLKSQGTVLLEKEGNVRENLVRSR